MSDTVKSSTEDVSKWVKDKLDIGMVPSFGGGTRKLTLEESMAKATPVNVVKEPFNFQKELKSVATSLGVTEGVAKGVTKAVNFAENLKATTQGVNFAENSEFGKQGVINDNNTDSKNEMLAEIKDEMKEEMRVEYKAELKEKHEFEMREEIKVEMAQEYEGMDYEPIRAEDLVIRPNENTFDNAKEFYTQVQKFGSGMSNDMSITKSNNSPFTNPTMQALYARVVSPFMPKVGGYDSAMSTTQPVVDTVPTTDGGSRKLTYEEKSAKATPTFSEYTENKASKVISDNVKMLDTLKDNYGSFEQDDGIEV